MALLLLLLHTLLLLTRACRAAMPNQATVAVFVTDSVPESPPPLTPLPSPRHQLAPLNPTINQSRRLDYPPPPTFKPPFNLCPPVSPCAHLLQQCHDLGGVAGLCLVGGTQADDASILLAVAIKVTWLQAAAAAAAAGCCFLPLQPRRVLVPDLLWV